MRLMQCFSGGASLGTSVMFVVKLIHSLSLKPSYLMNCGGAIFFYHILLTTFLNSIICGGTNKVSLFSNQHKPGESLRRGNS